MHHKSIEKLRAHYIKKYFVKFDFRLFVRRIINLKIKQFYIIYEIENLFVQHGQ